MAKEYKLGDVIALIAVTITFIAAAVFAIIGLFGETIRHWMETAITHNLHGGTVAVLIIAIFVALIAELSKWRISFRPQLRIWREPQDETK
jgi:hypothetical protein